MGDIYIKIPTSYKKDIEKAVKILKENGASEVYIFGSLANGKFNKNSDIDIAVKGLKKDKFFYVASILLFELTNKFDLVDLDEDSSFSNLLVEKGGMLKVG